MSNPNTEKTDNNSKRPLGSPVVWIKAFFEGLAENEVKVPCGTCDACCRSFDKVYLLPEEAEKYEHTVNEDGSISLLVDEEMTCHYLTGAGCATYHDRPLSCRQFDCRALAHCGVVPAEYPALKDAVLGWEVEFKTDGEKVLAMALRLAARKAAGEGASATESAGRAVMGGYKEFVDQARAVVKNDKIMRAAEEKPKFVDRFGRPMNN